MALEKTDVSEELSASIIGMTRAGHLGKTLTIITANVVPSSPILIRPMMEALSSSETSVLKSQTA
jgi:hypothetical protein